MEKFKQKLKSKKVAIQWILLITCSCYILYEYNAVYDPILMYAFAGLVKAGFVYFVWHFSKELATESKGSNPVIYGKTILVCGFLAFLAWGQYGKYIGNDEMLYGAEDSVEFFEPTDEERDQYGWLVFFIVCIPALMGTSKGLEKRAFNELVKASKKTD